MIIEIFHIVVHNLSLDWKVDQKIVMYADLSILKYAYITVLSVFPFHLSRNCATLDLWNRIFDLPTQSVTYNINTHMCTQHMSCVTHLLKKKDFTAVELPNYSLSGVISKVICCTTKNITIASIDTHPSWPRIYI